MRATVVKAGLEVLISGSCERDGDKVFLPADELRVSIDSAGTPLVEFILSGNVVAVMHGRGLLDMGVGDTLVITGVKVSIPVGLDVDR